MHPPRPAILAGSCPWVMLSRLCGRVIPKPGSASGKLVFPVSRLLTMVGSHDSRLVPMTVTYPGELLPGYYAVHIQRALTPHPSVPMGCFLFLSRLVLPPARNFFTSNGWCLFPPLFCRSFIVLFWPDLAWLFAFFSAPELSRTDVRFPGSTRSWGCIRLLMRVAHHHVIEWTASCYFSGA